MLELSGKIGLLGPPPLLSKGGGGGSDGGGKEPEVREVTGCICTEIVGSGKSSKNKKKKN